jgi:hypothetical protein
MLNEFDPVSIYFTNKPHLSIQHIICVSCQINVDQKSLFLTKTANIDICYKPQIVFLTFKIKHGVTSRGDIECFLETPSSIVLNNEIDIGLLYIKSTAKTFCIRAIECLLFEKYFIGNEYYENACTKLLFEYPNGSLVLNSQKGGPISIIFFNDKELQADFSFKNIRITHDLEFRLIYSEIYQDELFASKIRVPIVLHHCPNDYTYLKPPLIVSLKNDGLISAKFHLNSFKKNIQTNSFIDDTETVSSQGKPKILMKAPDLSQFKILPL